MLKNMKVRIMGPVFNEDGYSSHVKGLSEALSKECDLMVDCPKPRGWEHMCSGDLRKVLTKNFDIEETITIQIGLPPSWEIALSQNPKKFIGFLVWECYELPQQWADICKDKRVDQVWTPSEFTRQSAIRSGVDEKKIFVISHGGNPKLFFPKEVKK